MKLSELTKEIFTPRLRLERMTEEHIQEIVNVLKTTFENLKFYNPNWVDKATIPEDGELFKMVQEWIKSEENPSGVSYCAYDLKTSNFVGMGEIHHIDWSAPEGRIGYWVAASEEAKGYASEIANTLTRYVLDELGFERLELRAEERNPVSSHIAKKLGFTRISNITNQAGWNMEVFERRNSAQLPDLSVRYG